MTSNAENGLVLGDPGLAVCFSGRVYLTATPDARDAFCAHPLQYLRKTPQVKPFGRIWLVSSSNLSSGAGHQLLTTTAVAAALGLPAFDAIEILAKRTPMAMQMQLMEGKTLSGANAVGVIAGAIQQQQQRSATGVSASWVLSNLPFAAETIAALKERECLPEMVIFLDPSQELLEREAKRSEIGGGVLMLKHQQLQTSLVGGSEALKELGVVLKTSPLCDSVDDTVAAIRRQLNPLAPRIDRIEDGYVTAEDIASAFTPPPESESGEGTGSTDGEVPGDKVTKPFASGPRKGETKQFCPVSWLEKQTLVPGLPEFVSAFSFRFYCFAGKREQDAFERNPVKYLPKSSNATSSLVPTVVLLGVRGTGVPELSEGVTTLLNSASKGYSVIDLDLPKTNERLAKRLRSESLKSEEIQRSPLDLYVEELKSELQSSSSMTSEPLQPSCIVLGGLGAEESRLPSTDLLVSCFQQDVLPILVIPVSMPDEQILQTQLKHWRVSLPERRKKLKARRPTSPEDDGESAEPGKDEEPEFNLEEAEAEEIQRLQEQLQADQEAFTAAIDALRARGIAITTSAPVDVSGSFRQSVSKIAAEVDALMRRKDALFDSCEVVSEPSTVINALATGEMVVGKHGTICPVTGDAVITPLATTGAVEYRGRLYFPRDKDAIAAFLSTPSQYIHSSVPSKAPAHQPTCCIAGAPFVGKTRFAHELAAKYKLVYVSPKRAIDWVLQCHGGTSLSKRLRASQTAGANPDASTVDEAMMMRLQSSECQLNGWVLDDFLQTQEDLKRFKDNNSIEPGLLFILDGSFQVIWDRRKRLIIRSIGSHGDPGDIEGAERSAQETQQIQRVELNAARNLLLYQFSSWHRQRLDLLAFWTTQYGSFHVRQVDATQTSLWNALAQAHERLESHILRMRSCRNELVAGRPARMDGVVRRLGTLEESQSHPVFQRYCPVELSSLRYSSSSWTSNRQCCVQYQGRYFWLANAQSLEQFVANPMEFIGSDQLDEASALIAKAPLDASLLSLISVADCEFPELKGYCPVTFKLGKGAKDWSAIVKGQIFYRASYLHKVYFFASEEMRRKFLAEPALYSSQKLPVKLPPQLSTTLAKNFPGKLEQELSAVLNESLLVLGSERPKFLQASARASACFYLALVLKTRAKSLPAPVKTSFQAKKETFELDCRLSEMLKAAVTPINASCGTAVKGVRAVRGSNGAIGSVTSGGGGQDLDVQELCRRFDTITGCSGGNPSINAATVKAAFLEYAAL